MTLYKTAILAALDEQLQAACENAEAGFFFEEGGCYGMALSLHKALTNAGIPAQLSVSDDVEHASVLADDLAFDYTGSRPIKPTDRVVTEAEMRERANQSGRDVNSLFSDEEWAREIIESVLDQVLASQFLKPMRP